MNSQLQTTRPAPISPVAVPRTTIARTAEIIRTCLAKSNWNPKRIAAQIHTVETSTHVALSSHVIVEPADIGTPIFDQLRADFAADGAPEQVAV
jgi:hypothetical protein